MKRLKKDSLVLGIIIGTVLPSVLFGILYAISHFFAPDGKDYLVQPFTLVLISIFPNLFTLRYYLVKLNFDRTGRGILLVTFVVGIFYFAFYGWA